MSAGGCKGRAGRVRGPRAKSGNRGRLMRARSGCNGIDVTMLFPKCEFYWFSTGLDTWPLHAVVQRSDRSMDSRAAALKVGS